MTGSIGGEQAFTAYERYPDLGMLLGPSSWRHPWCEHYALDNDVYGAFDRWVKGKKYKGKPALPPAEWWRVDGETNWFRMLCKQEELCDKTPIFCVLPDEVANWEATIDKAYKYRGEVERRGWKTALALQDGCSYRDLEEFAPDAIFIGGSTRWKWRNMERIIKTYKTRYWVHAARINGTKRIRAVKQWGAHSADGTGLCRHFTLELPKVVAGLYVAESRQQLKLF